tara:strand:- start:954 stop:2093 length:1140 start_codon:yes stop_codon:yes gene_type:complete
MYSTIKELLNQEMKRQHVCYELIASQNFVSRDVAELCGSVFTNNALEGLPAKRYYNGCKNADAIEQLAIDSAKELFVCEYANVQPHCGTTANFAVYQALLETGDSILGMDMRSGGHLSHGAPRTQAYQMYNIHTYGVDKFGLLNYDLIEAQAKTIMPKVIIAGSSSYPRQINWQRFRTIANEVGAILLADICHYSGLITGGVYESPFPYAHIVTSTTNKTLRGPRGAIILWNDSTYTNKINNAVYPGQQGSPMMNIIAAKAQCFREALLPSFKVYANNVLLNAKGMCEVFKDKGLNVQTGGTDCHIILLNFSQNKYSGKQAADALEKHNIIVNKNPVPSDPRPLSECSGIRIGTAAETTKGTADFTNLACQISEILNEL